MITGRVEILLSIFYPRHESTFELRCFRSANPCYTYLRSQASLLINDRSLLHNEAFQSGIVYL